MSQWEDVGDITAFENGRMSYKSGSAHIGLFLVDGSVHAIDNLCTHGNACLTDGELEDSLIECPLHAGLVDVRTGRAAGAPIIRDSRTYAVRVDNGRIFVELPS